jgi:hypothetical protein
MQVDKMRGYAGNVDGFTMTKHLEAAQVIWRHLGLVILGFVTLRSNTDKPHKQGY